MSMCLPVYIHTHTYIYVCMSAVTEYLLCTGTCLLKHGYIALHRACMCPLLQLCSSFQSVAISNAELAFLYVLFKLISIAQMQDGINNLNINYQFGSFSAPAVFYRGSRLHFQVSAVVTGGQC